ncbi:MULTISPECIES: haloacid dehalogenase type II [Rhodomicrobium]|uniref:haloacid dehalogenase type II n=1 Tax=Rhodomicrobium TaxID=1068 RepID=UPI000B4AF24C|nr:MULTISPECIES: haloacid dehalogenase type II [Rhodomicrobium]
MSYPTVKAVLFDAYGTLFDVHSPMASLAAEIGPDAAAISELWRSKQLQYTWLRSLMGSHAPLDVVTAEALDFALNQYGIADPGLRERLLGLYLKLEAYPDAVRALRALKERGLVTGILSNGAPDMLESIVETAGLADLVDHVLSVESVGIYKPHTRVYRLGEERLQLPVSMIGFVSANGWDAAGAANYGFAVIHLNRFEQPAENLPGKPTLVLKSLDEAAAAILNG